MAHRKNPRFLRSSIWRNPVFCTFTRNKQRRTSWTKKLKRLNTRTSFSTKIFMKNKKNFFAGSKKNTSILKLTRTVMFSSHYGNKIISLMSKAVSLPMQNQLNKLNKQRLEQKNKNSFTPRQSGGTKYSKKSFLNSIPYL